MKNLEKMIEEIDIESLEKTINMLSGLQIVYKGLRACKEKKEPGKSTEEQIFELIKKNAVLDLLMIKSFISFDHCIIGCSDEYLKQCLFLSIMKGVHEFIEDKNDKSKDWYIYSCYNEYCFMRYKNMIHYPEYFYFSSKENTEKAFDILSNFFGINILNWFHKDQNK